MHHFAASGCQLQPDGFAAGVRDMQHHQQQLL
jgi:hypothetical protein